MAAKPKVSAEVQKWLDCIGQYDREFKKWESLADRIIKRYKDDGRKADDGTVKFNILWSNVQTLVPAVFSRVPQPDVSRRFRDNDPVGRVASLLLERALDFEIKHYSDYAETLKSCVLDRFLGGRATAWVRYEPHFTTPKQHADGLQVTEDAEVEGETEEAEELDYECSPVDYVHWRDFGHTIARTWEEVTAVWRVVYMGRQALVERFGKEIGEKVPLDASPEDLKRSKMAGSTDREQACVYEVWDKATKSAIWISKSLGEVLDQRPDPLRLEGFFPCPRPMYATISNESLVPVPDFYLYQDQAIELDTLADRIDGLIKALQVKGCYDASIPELARLFTEGFNTQMIPVKNWAAFAEKNGLDGALSLVDLAPIAKALEQCYLAMQQVKQQVFEIYGLSDLVRGATDPNETLGAQELKGQYANLRLRHMQHEVARFATDLLKIKAQIMCGYYRPQTIATIAAAAQLSPVDQQVIPQAMELLMGPRAIDPAAPQGPNPLRSFRVEVSADSLVQIDENAEKQGRVEFLTAVGAFLDKAIQAGTVAPQMTPLLMELLKFGVTGFKVGKSIEGSFDETAERLKQASQQPQGIPPEIQKQMAEAQAQLQAESERLTQERQKLEGERTQHAVEKIALKAEKDVFGIQKQATELALKKEAEVEEMGRGFEQERMRMAEEGAKEREGAVQQAYKAVDTGMSEVAKITQQQVQVVEQMAENIAALNEAITSLAQAVKGSRPVSVDVEPGADGRAAAHRVKYGDGEERVIPIRRGARR